MSTIDKAAQVIADHNADGVCNEPECIAGDLARAGLLAPDLPEMKERYGTVQNDWVRVDDDGASWIRYGVDDTPLDPGEARKLGLALLAAAKHAEDEA